MSKSLGADLMLTKAKLVDLEKENEEKLEHIRNLNERLTQKSLEFFVNVNGLSDEITALKTAALTVKHESNQVIRHLQQELQKSARDLLHANQFKDEQKPTHKLSDDLSDDVSDDLSDEVSDDLSDEVSDDLSHDDNDFGTTENKLALCMYVVGYKNWHVSDDIQNTFSSVHAFVLMLIALWKTYFQYRFIHEVQTLIN
jgi:predicted ATPase